MFGQKKGKACPWSFPGKPDIPFEENAHHSTLQSDIIPINI